MTRTGLIHLLTSYKADVAIYESTNLETALDYLHSETDYDLIFTELEVPGHTAEDVISKLQEVAPAAHLAIFCWSRQQAEVRQAIARGARSHLNKEASAEEVKLAVHGLLQGKPYLPELMFDEAAAGFSSEERLSPRQLEIMQLLAQGLSNKEIANILGITEGTIRVHLSAIFKSIKVSNRTEATLWYLLRQNKLNG